MCFITIGKVREVIKKKNCDETVRLTDWVDPPHSGPIYPFRRKSKCAFYFDVFRAFLNIKVGICIAMNVCIISKHILKSV